MQHIFSPKGLFCLALTLLPFAVQASEDDDEDFHFRPFWVEPADRIEWGHGHLVAGVDHEQRPANGARRRIGTPLEGTFGIGWGFSAVLALEGGAQSVFDQQANSHSANRAVKLRYSLPEWQSLHFMVLSSLAWESGNQRRDHSSGYALAWDIAPNLVLSHGQSWQLRQSDDARRGREWGVNLFRSGLGNDGRWALGGEWRETFSPDNTHQRTYLLGLGRVVGKGLMADLAIGRTLADSNTRRLTAGLSWFY